MSLNQVCREPDFENIRRVLCCEKPERPTLFEFFMNPAVYTEAAGPAPSDPDPVVQLAYMAKAYAACGYDYVNCAGCDIAFPNGETERRDTISLNAHALIQS